MNRFEAMSAVALGYADEIYNLRKEAARYRAALEQIVRIAPVKMQHHDEYWDGVNVGVDECKDMSLSGRES